jgi:hypothetical protein
MQFAYRRFWIETVATKSPTVTKSSATLPTIEIMPTSSYKYAQDASAGCVFTILGFGASRYRGPRFRRVDE